MKENNSPLENLKDEYKMFLLRDKIQQNKWIKRKKKLKENKVMTQEDISLLLQDLSARLSYGVICQVDDGAAGLNDGKLVEIDISKELVRFDADYYWDAYIEDIKPYLRPMSSMTIDESYELDHVEEGYNNHYDSITAQIDWLNAHHFDYRGLIEKGLALESKEGMYK